MEQLTGQDASFLYSETSRAPMHIGGIMIYDQSTAPGGRVRFKDILQFTQERLHLAKTFRQRVVEVPFQMDHPYWIEDADFDLEFHMRHIRLPEPGDWRQLCIQVARLHSRPLDRDKPLWEYTVIEGLDAIPGLPKGAFAIVSKVHHACIDGVSGIDLTQATHDLSADAPTPPPPEKPWQGESVPNPWELMYRAQMNNFVQPFRFAETMARALPATTRVAQGLATRELQPTATQAPATRFNRSISAHRVVEGRSFDLSAFKPIRAQVDGATVNDVVLTIVGGGLRRYLEDKGELPNQSMIAMAPISVRPESDRGALGNQVAAMMASLGTHVEAPLERLRHVREATRASKEMTKAVGAKLMTDFSQFIPSTTAALAARLYSDLDLANRGSVPPFNCVVTNVPGPQVPIYSGGAQLVAWNGLGPILDGMGLIFPVVSYCGRISISFTSCRAMVPDPDFLSSCLQSAFDDLVAAAEHAE